MIARFVDGPLNGHACYVKAADHLFEVFGRHGKAKYRRESVDKDKQEATYRYEERAGSHRDPKRRGIQPS